MVSLLHLGILNLTLFKEYNTPQVQQRGRRLVVSLKNIIIKPKQKNLPIAPKKQNQKVAKQKEQSPTKSENNKVQGIYDQYLMDLSKLLSKKKEYPSQARKMRIEGLVKIQFKILPSGQFQNIELIEKSHELLNKAALSLVQKASPFKAFPSELDKEEINVTLPIAYHLN